MSYYNLALDGGDANTFATRVLAFELTNEQRPIYISTLLAMLRDAYQQRNPAAVAFVRPFLTGLIPDHSITSYEQTLSATLLGEIAPAPAVPPAPPSNGGLKVESAVPPPTRPPAQAAETRRPAQSSKLSW